MNYQEALYHMNRLAEWADNETSPSTWNQFLALVGEVQGITVSKPIGFLEAGLLGKALQAYASKPGALKEHLQKFYVH